MNNDSSNSPLKLSLLLLRLGVFIVFFMWSLRKLLFPESTVKIFSNFYFIDAMTVNVSYVIGVIQIAIVVAFLLGIKKRVTYGILFLMHFFSTILSYEKYFDPWSSPNLLFFAAWPMLAAIAALYLMRDEDTLFTIGKNNSLK